MKKLITILVIAGILALIPLGIALAQTSAQKNPSGPNQSLADNMANYCQGGGGMMGGGASGNGMMGGGVSGNGMMGRGMMGGVGGSGDFLTGLGDPLALQRIASTLGITSVDLQTSLSKGDTIAQISQSKNVDTKLVVNTLLAPENELLQVRVKYGYLSQAMAQAIQDQSRLWAEQAIQRALNSSNNRGTNPGTTPDSSQQGGGMMGGGNGSGSGMMGR